MVLFRTQILWVWHKARKINNTNYTLKFKQAESGKGYFKKLNL